MKAAKRPDPRTRPPCSLQKWREQGSLRYLARCLKVTAKQVARYWDEGWIPRSYRTPKGHRRIRYEADTIRRVKLVREAAQKTNFVIRYDLQTVTHRGVRIPAQDCHSMHDLYRAARQAGLSEREAQAVAYRPRSRPTPAAPGLYEVALRLESISQEQVSEAARLYASLPLDSLLEPCSKREFRARASEAWRGVVEELEAEARWERLHGAPPELAVLREKKRQALRALLRHRDRDAFAAAWLLATDPYTRAFDHDAEYFRIVKRKLDHDPELMRLQVALTALEADEKRLSAAALARVLGISRRALYRAYGTEKIRAVLHP